jgi:hypothetical protein
MSYIHDRRATAAEAASAQTSGRKSKHTPGRRSRAPVPWLAWRSLSFSGRSGRPGCRGPTGPRWPRWPVCSCRAKILPTVKRANWQWRCSAMRQPISTVTPALPSKTADPRLHGALTSSSFAGSGRSGQGYRSRMRSPCLAWTRRSLGVRTLAHPAAVACCHRTAMGFRSIGEPDVNHSTLRSLARR